MPTKLCNLRLFLAHKIPEYLLSLKKIIEYIFDNKGVYKWDNLATGESV